MKRRQMVVLWSLALAICFSACDPKPENVEVATPEDVAVLATQPAAALTSTATMPPTVPPTVPPTEQVRATAAPQAAVPTSMPMPFPVTVSPGAWLVEMPDRDFQIQFDADRWESTQFDTILPLYYEGGPVLVHKEIDGCNLSLNVGGGVPMDWSLEKEAFLLGDHEIPQVSFRTGDGDLQFVIYDALLRVIFGDDVDGCLQATEVVISSYQVSAWE